MERDTTVGRLGAPGGYVSHRYLPAGNQRRLFGGALLAQMITTAATTAHDGSRVHSLHAHFLTPGRPDRPVDLSVLPLRVSRSFTTVSVRSDQHGVALATAIVSFHTPRRTRMHAPIMMPPHRPPDTSPSAAGGPLPDVDAPSRAGFDLREADETTTSGPDGRPVVHYWVRSRDARSGSTANAAALAWASDLCLTHVADLEHRHSAGIRQAASLDHAMWFHRPFDIGRWMLYEITSPTYQDGLALVTGRFYDMDGHLVASVAQESLLRRHPDRGES